MSRVGTLSKCLAAGALALAAVPPAAAQEAYPNRPIKIVVGFAAGALNDIMVRTITPRLSERLGQPIVVENRPGAGANIAAEVVARAAPDGYTLLAAPTSTLAINPAIYTKLTYDPQRDFAPIAQLAFLTLYLTTRTEIPANSLAELVAHAKANPQQANFANVAPVFEMLIRSLGHRTGTTFEILQYRSTAESMTALITGQAMLSFQDFNTLNVHLKAGKVRPLVNATTKRSEQLPDVPTFAEAGQPGLEFDSFAGLVAPKATPAAILKRIEAEALAVCRLPEVTERWRTLGITAICNDTATFTSVLTSEVKRWAEIAQQTGIKLD
jgi:tripartite-type tricarboxylate transporter receptor subunit TctC